MSAPSPWAGSRARRAVIVVFAKAPRPGLVKTRMSPPLTAEEAADLYQHMLDDVLLATARFALELDLQAVVAVHPASACGEIARRAPSGFRVVSQHGRDLSERMTWAAAEAAAAGADRILLRSSDSLVLGRGLVEECLAALEEVEVAIAPDCGGGYALIGVRDASQGLWDHPMSTASVLDDTLGNARRLGLRTRLVPETPDLDTAADLALLVRRRTDAAELCPQTLAFLDEHDFWPARDERH